MIHSCPFVNLQNLRNRQCIDFIFQLILIKLLIILMRGQQGRLLQGLHVYHATNNEVWLSHFSERYICIYVALRVGVYSMCIHAYLLLLIPSSEMQKPSKSQFKKLLSFLHITLLHIHSQWFRYMSLIIHQAESSILATDTIEVPLSSRD